MRRHEDEDYYDDEDEAPRSRALSIASVLAGVVAVIGFVWLAWHAYISGSVTSDPAQAELVHADASPYKDVPKDPGGWQAPHRDKTIYEVIERGNGQKTANVAEHLSAAPEEPMEVPAAPAKKEQAVVQSGSSSTWMNAKLRDGETEVPLTDAERQKVLRDEAKETAAPAPKAAAAPAIPAAKAPVAAAPVASVPDEEPKLVEEQPAAVKVAPVAAAPKPAATATATATATAAAPAKTYTGNGSARVQLGAFRSEGEAAAHVKHLGTRVPGVLNGKSTTVERADLGAKGIYYRLFALGFSKADATDACNRIKAARLDCMVK